MKRAFSSPIPALVAGALLRLFFVLRFPAGSGDTVIYEQLATNWVRLGKYAMDIAGQPVSVDLRMPGYPAFLAIIYTLTGHTGEAARRAVMFAQTFVDISTCVLIGLLASLIAHLRDSKSNSKRAFLVGLWLAALCPFTANYVAVPLTETWAIFFNALAAILLVALIAKMSDLSQGELPFFHTQSSSRLAVAAGLAVGCATLFRPESPLILVAALAVLACLRRCKSEWKPFVLVASLMSCAFVLPLVPWTIRNAITLHEFQPLTPKDANLPGELVPRGFMAWERTWLFRVRDCYLVPWKLNEEEIHIDDIPSAAFDTPEERDQVASLLETYNNDLTLTAEEDAAFAVIARQRTSRHPFRTYLLIPFRRAGRIWFTPRIELLPISGNVFPLAYMWQEDPVDQRVTILFFILNLGYVALAITGVGKLLRFAPVFPALAFLLLFILIRTAFLTTVETPEPRYVLVCFPALITFATQALAGRTPRTYQ